MISWLLALHASSQVPYKLLALVYDDIVHAIISIKIFYALLCPVSIILGYGSMSNV